VKRGLVALVVAIAVAAPVAAGAAAPAPSDRQRQIDAEARRLRQQVDEVAAQEADLLAELNVSRRARKELDAKLAELDRSLVGAQADQQRVDTELVEAVAAEQTATAAVEAAVRDLRTAKQTMREEAVQAYIEWGSAPDMTHVLYAVKDVNDAPRIQAYIDAVTSMQARAIRHFDKQQRTTAALEDAAKEAKASVAARQQEATARRVALQTARAEQADAQAAAAAEAANEQRLLAQVQSRRRAYQQRLNELQRESNDIAAQLRRRQRGQAPAPSGHGVLAYPVANPVITSDFGYRTHPIYGDRRLHAGIDLRASVGTPVYAADDGTVVFAGWKSGYGNTVVIDHGDHLATLYGHNSALKVADGATVRRGQQIAAAGSTGNSTGPHVHFEVRIDGAPVDPIGYL
jgi:murein DD-endopeptidase MepM/ murein hydrolase activator NlpD